jgi:hypothetical protein
MAVVRLWKGTPFRDLGPSATVEGFETGDFNAFTWAHVKSLAEAEGADATWLDDIEFPIW